MKRLFSKLLLSACVLGTAATSQATNFWQQVAADQAPKNLQVMHPTQFQVYTVDEATLKLQMWNLSTDPAEAMIVTLPMPDGSSRDFKVWLAPMMPDALSAKYPDIKTFSAEAVDDRRVTARMEFTVYGFSAMIFDGDKTSFVDPYDNYHDGFYMVHYKKDETRAVADQMRCLVKSGDDIKPVEEVMQTVGSKIPALAHRTTNGYNLRTYRLALSADSFYCKAATGILNPTITQAFSKMTISMNRINGVYNREFSVQMNFCANEDTLIFGCSGHTNGTDPFKTIDNNGNSCLSTNQPTCTNRIGSANYDIGHVFTTGGGGISSLGVVCRNSMKAQSCTGSPTPVGDGYDIDYVAHEMGHEYGSEHTFNNNNDGSCGGNAVYFCAYEPGSGGTIMDYAGICSPDDLQYHSDPYFSASSLVQIETSLTTNPENTCGVITSTGNKLVALAPFTTTYTIPYKTPFELIGPTAIDSAADTATTYDWLEWDLGGTTGASAEFGKRLNQTFIKGPIFRSYNPVYNPTRVFPKVTMVISGNLSNAGTEGAEGEKAPDTARSLKFKMVVRDILNGNGCFLFPDDSITLHAVATSTFAGFKVTSQNSTAISYVGGSTDTVTWNVVGTDAAPVSADSVDIFMSRDGGYTWPDTIGRFANNGSAAVVIPTPATTSSACRIKVKGAGNVFFNINSRNFTVTNSTGISSVKMNTLATDIKVFPVPATDMLHITATNNPHLTAAVYNILGQQVWNGAISGGSASISVSSWAKGVYHIRFTDTNNGNTTVRAVVIE